MKKVTLLTVILVTLFSACKKDSVQSPVEKPKEPNISQTKLVHNIFGSQEIKKFVKNVPEIIGQTQPAKLYEAVNKKSGIHKYFLYLNGNTTNEPIIIISKKELGPQINLATINTKQTALYFDENGNNIPGELRSKQNGKLINLNENLAAKESQPGQICIDWFWVIINDQGEVVGEFFIETKCYSSGEGGGGGGIGGGDPICNMTEEEAEAELDGIVVTAVDNLMDESSEPLSFDPIKQVIRGPKTLGWQFTSIAGPTLFNKTYWSAFFSGVVYKYSEFDDLKWESFNYSSSGMTGGWLPPCVDLTLNVGAISTIISNDKKTALISLTWYANSKISCVGSTFKMRSLSGTRKRSIKAYQNILDA